MTITKKDWQIYFPHQHVRDIQEKSIIFALNNILSNKNIVLEVTTGGGKSAIALTIAKWAMSNFPSTAQRGAYIITTQKTLQQQYVDDFPEIANIWSKSNYQCIHRKRMNCEEGQLMAKIFSGTKESDKCETQCIYTSAYKQFLINPIGITNMPYILNQIEYNFHSESPSLKKRQLLIVDECHNIEQSIVDFVATKIDAIHCENDLALKFPDTFENISAAREWVEASYIPALESKIQEILSSIEKLNPRSSEMKSLTKQSSSLDKICCKTKRFLEKFDPDRWVMTQDPRFFEIKPIYASEFAHNCLFSLGERVLLMSGTILDNKTFCKNVGISENDCSFMSLPSPFPVENRPIFFCPVGSMSYKNIDYSIKKMNSSVQKIMKEHEGQKGIIHAHTYNIAKYIKDNDKTKRILIHNSTNRSDILEQHLNSRKDSVLISPSFTEGIDLYNDHSRFQILCKIPFPFLQDNYIKTKMARCKYWYEWQTVKTIVQSLGRSVRSESDYAVSYILDSDFEYFYKRNNFMFPDWFKEAMIFV